MDDDVRAVGLQAGQELALLEGHVRQVAGDALDVVLRQHRAVHVGALGPVNALHHGGQGGEGAAGAAPGLRQGQGGMIPQGMLQNVRRDGLHGGQIAVVADGDASRQADSAHLAGKAAAHVHPMADDDLRGAAADVDHAGVAPVRRAIKGQRRFLSAGADLQLQACFSLQQRGEIRLVGGIPRGAGGKEVKGLAAFRPGGLRHLLHRRAGGRHRLGGEVPPGVQTGKQARSGPFTAQAVHLLPDHLAHKHSDGIRSDTDDCNLHLRPSIVSKKVFAARKDPR